MTTLLFASIIFSYCLLSTGWSQYCPNQDIAWEKIAGTKPANAVKTILYRNSAINNDGIVAPCFNKCRSLNCTAFLIDFARNVCYNIQVKSDELIPETNATFFHQICIKVPLNCKRYRLWQVERTLGAILKAPGHSGSYEQVLSRRNECYEECFLEGNECASVQFRTNKPLSIDNSLGTCLLSKFERGTKPQAYRSSMYRDEYLQDQCHNISKKSYCSYAEIRNATLPYSDVALPGLDLKQCENRCDRSEDGFICRAYTVDYSERKPLCLLHSDDTIGLGVSSLVKRFNVIYKEQEACLDLTVQCDDSALTVTLTTAEPFEGWIYANGYRETCGVHGVKNNVTVLTLPLPRKEYIGKSDMACGLTAAHSVDNENRTRILIWTIIVIQYNSIIQQLGDQSVRVGCSLDDRDLPEPRNVSVHSNFTFLDPNAGVPPIGSTVVNASSEAPVVTMRILNEQNMDAVVTQLGQKLTLRIEIHPVNGPYDIAAGRFIASSASGASSYFLLDEVGCPTDPTTFPPLLKDPIDNRSLISTFTAFKFPDSQIVRFNVIVRFCLEECEPSVCREGQISYGRKRRSIEQPINAEVTEIFRNLTPAELPLQLSIVVQSPLITADHLMSRENPVPDTVFIAGKGSIDGLFCVDASLALGLLIFWLIIQIVLTVGCLLAVRRYRRMAVEAEEDRADILARHLYGIHGGNFEIARRVRWADRNDSSIG